MFLVSFLFNFICYIHARMYVRSISAKKIVLCSFAVLFGYSFAALNIIAAHIITK